MKKPIEIQKTHAQCWVCVEQGITGYYPVATLIKLTQGQYRCRNHKGAEILEAGKQREKKQC